MMKDKYLRKLHDIVVIGNTSIQKGLAIRTTF